MGEWGGRSTTFEGGGVKLRQALIIGAGIAGISAALGLADRGVFVNLVDAEGTIGGRAKELSCKGVDECVRCDVCLAIDKLYEVGASERIRVFPNSTIRSISGEPGNFRVTLERNPGYVSEDCTACGACAEACPVPGGAIGPPGMGIPLTYAIDPNACLWMRGEDCRSCEEACPHGAIDLARGKSTKRLRVGALVVATGFQPFDPSLEPRYSHDLIPGVITSLEAERMLNLDGRLLLPDGSPPRRVAFIQCVGSRDSWKGVEYCSKVCCKYSMAIALNLRALDPDADITFFYMDWRPYDLRGGDIGEWASRDPRLSIVRSRPAEVLASDSGKPVVRYVGVEEEIAEDEFDMVILSIGMGPPEGIEDMAEMLGLEMTPQGFLWTSVERPAMTSRPGVFASGCCTGPKDIEESAMEGVAAAGEAASFLEGSR